MTIKNHNTENMPASFNQTEYAPPTKPFKRISLEMSLKPFYDTTPKTREKVCRKLFQQWMPLCKDTDVISVMLWVGDGGELLNYNGNMDDTFEWSKWLGCVSSIVLKKENEEVPLDEELELDGDDQGLGLHGKADDPDGIGLHRHAYLYRDTPAEFTYRWLRDLISDLKRIGRELTDKPIEVGDTFDPGPEFAISKFKYERHPEILKSVEFMGSHFVYCGTTLEQDDTPYATFPNGIPAGTHLGTFMGRQTQLFFDIMGFDFLWFSNGFGFGSETLSLHGKLFDGKTFTPDKIAEYEATVYKFWKLFRTEAPQIPLRMRGTNLTTGVDLASDAVPLNKIYKETGNFEPPVNSPWAAMDGDFGLEFAGWMSHIAELPGNTFPFRFYINDPWWMNSPWLDRYERSPHDIYMPLSICRLKEDGTAHTPETICFLSTDNSIGQLPDQVAADVSSHVIHARENQPDQAGPLVWIYPWDEYHQMTFSDTPKLKEVYSGDWYVRGIINQGFPLNTVISTTNFISATKSPEQWLGNILFVSTASEPKVQEKVLAHITNGGRAIFYGPINENSKILSEILGLKNAPELEGDFSINWSRQMSPLLNFAWPEKIHHPATFSGGGLSQCSTSRANVEEIASASQNGKTRSLAILAQRPEWNGGQLGWLRGSMSCNEKKIDQFLPAMLSEKKIFHTEKLARLMLDRMGLQCRYQLDESGDKAPLLTISRSRNAFIFSGYNPDAAEISLKLPLGAPVLTSKQTKLKDGNAHWQTTTGWQSESRILVKQEENSRITCKELPVIMAGYHRRLLLTGLNEAIVRFFPLPGTEDSLEFLRAPSTPYIVGDFIKPIRVESHEGTYFETEKLSYRLLISW